MNRREMLKRVVGVGTVLGVAPVVAKLNASVTPHTNDPLCGTPCSSVPERPLDVRTPGQVYEDETNNQVEHWLRRIEHPTTKRYYNCCRSMSYDTYVRLRDKLQGRGISLPIQYFGTKPWASRSGVVIDDSPVLLY